MGSAGAVSSQSGRAEWAAVVVSKPIAWLLCDFHAGNRDGKAKESLQTEL